MAKAKRPPKSIDRDHLFVPVDVFPNSTWDEDLGMMVTANGVVKCLQAVQPYLAEGWKFEDLQHSNMDESLFLVKLYHDEGSAKAQEASFRRAKNKSAHLT
jgi:hypothetical protein